MHVFSKQPSEEFLIEGDFSKDIGSGETIVLGTSTVVAEDKTGTADSSVLDQSAKAISSSLKGLVIRVKAGAEDKSPYKITFVIITSLNNKWELDVVMGVSEG